MIPVACSSPFIPPEWIAAHGMRPVWLHRSSERSRPSQLAQRGVCHFAESLIDQATASTDVGAIVLTTICDQMRYAAAYLDTNCPTPVFLFNMPSTWESPGVQQLYQDELSRLGRFLESVGGGKVSPDDLRTTMQRYDCARSAARKRWPHRTDGRYAQWLAELRNNATLLTSCDDAETTDADMKKPLALVGGPLWDDDYALFDVIADAGGRIVLDASEWGQRTLPGPLDLERVERDPLAELTRIYFQEIPDVFRRPNTRLYEWLGEHLSARGVRGILFWRRLFCDLWHAELEPMRQWSSVPVLDLEAADGEGITPGRMLGRIEAFLEMLP